MAIQDIQELVAIERRRNKIRKKTYEEMPRNIERLDDKGNNKLARFFPGCRR